MIQSMGENSWKIFLKNDEILHENRRTICLEAWKWSWRYKKKQRNKYENKEIQGPKIWIKQKSVWAKRNNKKWGKKKNIKNPKKKKKMKRRIKQLIKK